MLDSLVWLARLETALASTLAGVVSSTPVEAARRLRSVAKGKRQLARETLSAASRIRGAARRPPRLSVLRGLMDDVEDSLCFLAAALGSDMRGQELADSLAAHELLKWNNLFLPLGSHVKEGFPEGVRFLVTAQKHKRALERFCAEEASPWGSFAMRAADPVWRERVLFIGEFGPPLKSALRADCVVEDASGADAIEVLRQRYYGAVIADEDLTGLKSSELLRKAARSFPGIEERFLFLYGHEKKGATGGKGARRIHRSEPPERISEEVGMILDR